MSYNTGNLSAGSNAAQNLMDTIQPLIDAHAAWQFIEQVVSTTIKVDIYKSLGAQNGLGNDFFVGIKRSADNGTVTIMLAEQYDGSGKNFINSVYYSTAAITVNADGTYNLGSAKHVATASTNPGTTTNTIAGFGGASYTNVGLTGAAIAPSTPWFLSVTTGTIAIACGPMSHYVGLYDSSYSLALDPWPICVMYLQPVSWVPPLSGTTTLTINTGTAMKGSGGYTRDIGGAMSTLSAGVGFINGGLIRYIAGTTPTAPKDPISGNWLAQRVALGSAMRPAARRGLLKSHVIAIPMPEVTMGVGDTITVDGVQYVCFNTHNSTGAQFNNADSIWVSTAA